MSEHPGSGANQFTPLNLVIEAPLSVAFLPNGNPTGRAVERRGVQTRNWYVGLGCAVLVSATYLMRTLTEASRNRDIRLIEGFASFKAKGTSSHSDDVLDLRRVARGDSRTRRILQAADLRQDEGHRLASAFAVAGMDYGIPPVIVVNKSIVTP